MENRNHKLYIFFRIHTDKTQLFLFPPVKNCCLQNSQKATVGDTLDHQPQAEQEQATEVH